MSTTKAVYSLSPTTRLEIAEGNLLSDPLDAIVNAANRHLEHGGGIAAAIAKQGGPAIQRESDDWVREHGPVSHSEPAVTGGGKLPARYVIHAVGPVWGAGDETAKLAQAISGSLRRAEEMGLGSIGFPAISIGIFHFPVKLAAQVFTQTMQGYFADGHTSPLELVRIVLLDGATAAVFLEQARVSFLAE